MQAAVRLAGSGLGVALLPDNMIPSDINAPVLRVDPPVGRELAAYTRSEWSPAARAFLDIVQASIGPADRRARAIP